MKWSVTIIFEIVASLSFVAVSNPFHNSLLFLLYLVVILAAGLVGYMVGAVIEYCER